MVYLNFKDRVVAAAMALSTLGLMGAFCSTLVMGTKRALAEPPVARRSRGVQKALAPLPGADGLGALVMGGLALSLTRRLLRG